MTARAYAMNVTVSAYVRLCVEAAAHGVSVQDYVPPPDRELDD